MNSDRNPGENGSSFVTEPGVLALFFLYLAAAWFGAGALAAVLFAAFLFSLLSLVWGRNALKKVRFRLEGRSLRVFPGQEVSFSVTVENRKWLPLFWLTVLLPEPERRLFPVTPGHFSWILPWQEVKWEQIWKAERRGVYMISAAELISGDGFGLSVQRGIRRPEKELMFVVYPKPAAVRQDALPIRSAEMNAGSRGYLVDPSLLRGIRDYQPGDGIRGLNWRMLARQGEAKTNLFETILPERPTFLLDLASFGNWREIEGTDASKHYYITAFLEEEMEEMISLAASLIIRNAERKANCALILPELLPAERDAGEENQEQENRRAQDREAEKQEPQRQSGQPDIRGSARAAEYATLPGGKGGVFSPENTGEMIPELLTELAAIRYDGGPAVFPTEEILRNAGNPGQLFVLCSAPERLTCRPLLERFPENRICLIVSRKGEGHPFYPVLEGRGLLA